ncbi:hypothetical protein [Ornithinimicrobium cavernae]|uniref:hypothetical protein n=1 Tax=Ornithinimicrobium cavernae TaxID=2666047 RepID=UPI000D69DA34|nr:hypothetical protein [Ornithinimicrobium cavernae]
MSPGILGRSPEGDEARFSRQLCRTVGDVEFDYAALVHGVHRRVGQIRRRRAIATGATVAVLGPALVGGSALVLPGLLPSGIGPGTPETTLAAAPTEEAADRRPEPTASTTDPAAGSTVDPTTTSAVDPTASTPETETETEGRSGEELSGGEPTDPPWQEAAPPLPEGGLQPGDSGNAWEIPDARPTGVAALDEFGAPQLGSNYRRTVPVSGPMVCNGAGPGSGPGVEPLAGQEWMYYHEGGSWAPGTVTIQVTGWEDSVWARDALRDATMTYCVRDADGDWERLTWAGRDGDDDYLLYRATSAGVDYRFAVVRRGDYLVGVTVTGTTGADVAAEVASRTADNLEALDPVHGRG